MSDTSDALESLLASAAKRASGSGAAVAAGADGGQLSEQWHCFWVNPYGMHHEYKAFDDIGPVLALVGKNNQEYGSSPVCNLRVVYGELLEFEPTEVVKSWKVKHQDE